LAEETWQENRKFSNKIYEILVHITNLFYYLLAKERIGQHTRDATIQGLGIAQQAANVAATARG